MRVNKEKIHKPRTSWFLKIVLNSTFHNLFLQKNVEKGRMKRAISINY